MSIVTLLQELASAKPDIAEVNKLLNQQNDEIKQAILRNDNEALRNLVSDNRIYANETKVTLY